MMTVCDATTVEARNQFRPRPQVAVAVGLRDRGAAARTGTSVPSAKPWSRVESGT